MVKTMESFIKIKLEEKDALLHCKVEDDQNIQIKLAILDNNKQAKYV
jgi:hypothetical protein